MNTKPIITGALLLLVCGFNSLHAQLPFAFCVDTIAPPKGSGPWPGYSKLRFNEDYSRLSQFASDEIPYRDVFDKLKTISVGNQGAFLSIGGSARLRYEGYENANFGPSNDDKAYVLSRFLAHADLRINDRLRFFGELRSANAYGRDLPGGRTHSLVDEFDVMNLFVDVVPYRDGDASLTVRMGRFEHLYGSGRMIGHREWSQTRTPVQGAKLRYVNTNLWIDVFGANTLLSTKYDWAEVNNRESIWGIYSHFHGELIDHWEVYVLGKNRVIAGQDVDRVSTGVRLDGSFGKSGVNYEFESAYQTGTGDVDVRAYFWAMDLSKTWSDVAWRPSLQLSFEYASGDKDPTDDQINTFEPVIPFGHYYFGYTDVVGRQNIVSPSLQVVVHPSSKWMWRTDVHMFWLAEPADALYSPANSSQAIRRGFEGASSYVGAEVDLSFRYLVNRHWNVIGGVAHLFSGDFIAETGADADISRVFVQLLLTF